jgi:CheY-like chemotaxis protein
MSEINRVLFVDDSEVDRVIISNILDELDIDSYACATVQEFLPKIKEYEPDLCLVDLNIQRRNDGTILVEAIRNRLGKSLPIIVISANDSNEEIQGNLKAGANDFICKPIDKALLSSKISNYLRGDIIDTKALSLFSIPASLKNSIEVKTSIKLFAVSETGLEFSCEELNLNLGSVIKVANELFTDVFPDQEYLYLKIQNQIEDRFAASFEDLSDSDIHKLRILILTKR